MKILNDIVLHKRAEVVAARKTQPLRQLETYPIFSRTPHSLKNALALTYEAGLIAEFKKKSPSRGIINDAAKIITTTQSFVAAGATALSVLTDNKFFGGCNSDLSAARAHNNCPILRKDFVIDAYQIVEAKAIGADAILLIAAILTKDQLKGFTSLAHSLGLEVLLEIHEAKELDDVPPGIDIIGVNNRNLQTFETDINVSLRLSDLIPSAFLKISESAISSADIAFLLKQSGYNGFLVGEQFMKHDDPGVACATFLQTLKQKTNEN